MTTTDTPSLVVTLGTESHLFDRCIQWLDNWLADREEIAALVQHGYSSAPRHGSAVAMLPRQELLERMTTSSIVVTHGGGGTVMDARSAGLVPVVVPRLAALGEHVDDHQLHFSRRLAETGWIHLAETEAALHRHLDSMLEDRSAYRQSATADASNAAATRMDRVLTGTMHGSTRRFHPRRVGHVVRFALRRRDTERRVRG